jgi:hypothetical protein
VRRRRGGAPVPTVDPGSICLRVRCRGLQSAQAAEAMTRAGAISIERSGS